MPKQLTLRRALIPYLIAIILCLLCNWIMYGWYESGELPHNLVEQALVPLLMIGDLLGILGLILLITNLRLLTGRVIFDVDGVINNAAKSHAGFLSWGEIENLDILRGPLGAKITIRFRPSSGQDPLVIYGLKVSDKAERTIRYLHLEASSRHS